MIANTLPRVAPYIVLFTKACFLLVKILKQMTDLYSHPHNGWTFCIHIVCLIIDKKRNKQWDRSITSYYWYFLGWKVLRIGEVSSLMSSSAMLAIDCEMVLCNDGTEAVVRVCVVDDKLKVLDYLVRTSMLRFMELSCALMDIAVMLDEFNKVSVKTYTIHISLAFIDYESVNHVRDFHLCSKVSPYSLFSSPG